MTHYLIYKITNKINGKFYIGQHQTEDLNDGYMGSGTYIRRAIKKYGVENFSKEILYEVDNEELMNLLEELIVDEEFVARKDTYNLRTGGRCQYHLSEESRRKISEANKKRPPCHPSEETRRKMSEATKKQMTEEARRHLSDIRKGIKFSNEHKSNLKKNHKGMKGKHHSEETKRKMREARRRYLENKSA